MDVAVGRERIVEPDTIADALAINEDDDIAA
jgi:hypothetical protein